MRYTTRTRLKKMIYITLAIMAFAALNFWLITKVFNTTRTIEKSITLIASGENAMAYPYKDGVLAVMGDKLISYDAEGAKQYTATLPRENMKAFKNDAITIAWDTKIAIILNSSGEQRLVQEFDGDILLATCNASQFAVAIIEEEQFKIRVFDFNGFEIWDNLFPDMSILNIGYFGQKNEQLWVLVLDYHGTLPITKLFTNHPGSSQTGRITVNNQVCYAVEPLENEVYLVGTHHIQARTYTDTKTAEMLINGWALQDSFVGEKGEVSFLLAPVDTTGLDVPLSALWYIAPNFEQYRISMPAGIKRAVLTQDKIYAISKEGVYDMRFNGEKRDFSKLPFVVDEVLGIIDGKGAILRAGNDIYTITLNK